MNRMSRWCDFCEELWNARIYKRRLGYLVVRPGIPTYGAPRESRHLTRLGALRAAQQWNELRPTLSRSPAEAET